MIQARQILLEGRKQMTKDNHDKNRKKSVWRLIVGVILLGVVSTSLRNHPDSGLIFNLLLAAIGVWLAVSYLRSGKR